MTFQNPCYQSACQATNQSAASYLNMIEYSYAIAQPEALSLPVGGTLYINISGTFYGDLFWCWKLTIKLGTATPDYALTRCRTSSNTDIPTATLSNAPVGVHHLRIFESRLFHEQK